MSTLHDTTDARGLVARGAGPKVSIGTRKRWPVHSRRGRRRPVVGGLTTAGSGRPNARSTIKSSSHPSPYPSPCTRKTIGLLSSLTGRKTVLVSLSLSQLHHVHAPRSRGGRPAALLANSERRRLQSAQTPGMNTETLCSMNYGCNTVSASPTPPTLPHRPPSAARRRSRRARARAATRHRTTVEMRASRCALAADAPAARGAGRSARPQPVAAAAAASRAGAPRRLLVMASRPGKLWRRLWHPRVRSGHVHAALQPARISPRKVQEVPPLSSLRDSTTWPTPRSAHHPASRSVRGGVWLPAAAKECAAAAKAGRRRGRCGRPPIRELVQRRARAAAQATHGRTAASFLSPLTIRAS